MKSPVIVFAEPLSVSEIAIFWTNLRRFAFLNQEDVVTFTFNGSDSLDFTPTVPTKILTVGPVATAFVLGSRYTNMRACNAATFMLEQTAGSFILGHVPVVPCFHPGLALGGGIEDALGWMCKAMEEFRFPKTYLDAMLRPDIPPPIVCAEVPVMAKYIAIDTEGTPEAPLCLTWAVDGVRAYVSSADIPDFDESLREALKEGATLIYHNAPWDWQVMEAMGMERVSRLPFLDTMQMGYRLHISSQSLKDLSWHHLRIPMTPWSDLVMPHYDKFVQGTAKFVVDGATTIQTHSLKTGKLFKKPKVTVLDSVKPIKRALNNPKLLAKRMALGPPSLLHIPYADMVEYATLDPFATLHLAYKMGDLNGD